MFVENDLIYFEDADKCQICENLKYCYIIDLIKRNDIEIIDAIDTKRCNFFMLCDKEVNGDYLAELLTKTIKEFMGD